MSYLTLPNFMTALHSPLSPICTVPVCMGVGPATGAWATQERDQLPEENRFSLSLPPSAAKASQLGLGLHEPLPTGSHDCCGPMITMALRCPEDMASQVPP